MPQVIITIDLPALLIAALLLLLLLLLPWLVAARRGRRARRSAAALGALPQGLVILDPRGRRRWSNDPATMLLGQVDPARVEQIRRLATTGLAQTSLIYAADGSPIQLHAYPLASGQDVLLTLRTLEQHQQIEANYRKFLHTVSHELLTPLTSLQLRLSQLAAGAKNAHAESLVVARADVERLIRLTSNLLLLSRLEAGQPLQRRPTNLAAVAEEVVLQLLEDADARRITLTIHAPPRLARPLVDRDAWKQIFLNLIGNAVKYGHEGGRVDVVLRQEPQMLLLTVADDGPGIEEEDIPHVFSELFRAEAQRHTGGSGLGLTLVRRMVEQHGGQISCRSEPGRGASFEILLPLEEANVTAS